MNDLRVGEIMTTPAWTLQTGDSVARAKSILSDRRIRRLPVLEGDRLVGILSDRDLRPCAPPQEPNRLPILSSVCDPVRTLDGIRVLEVMRPTPVSIGPYHPVIDAARLMVEHELHALPVVDQKRVIGIITQSDVLRALVGSTSAPVALKAP